MRRSSEPAKERPHVADKEIRRLHGGKMSSAVELRPVNDSIALFGVAPDGDVLGEDRHAGGHAGRLRPVAGVGILVVESAGSLSFASCSRQSYEVRQYSASSFT